MPLTNKSTSNVALQPTVPAQSTRPKTVSKTTPDSNMLNTPSTSPSLPTKRGRKRKSQSKAESVPSDESDTENGNKIPYKKPDRKGKPKNKKKTTRPSFSYVSTPHVNVLEPVELPTRRRSELKAADAKNLPSNPTATTALPDSNVSTTSSPSAATTTNSTTTSASSPASVAVSSGTRSTDTSSPVLATPLTSAVSSPASSSGPSSSSLPCQAAPADPANPVTGQQDSVASDNQTNVKEEIGNEPVNVEMDCFGTLDDLEATPSNHKFNQQMQFCPVAQETKLPPTFLLPNFADRFEPECQIKELGNISTQPMRVLVFNAPFDISKTNYFKIENLSENRIGVKMEPSSRERLTVGRTIICLEPHESVNVNVRSKVFQLESAMEDKIVIEWMNIPDGVIDENFTNADGARNRKTMTVQFSL